MGTWAGARIICLGEYCDRGDVPSGFLRREEEDVLHKGLAEDEVDPDELTFIPGPASLLDVALCRLQEIKPEVEPLKKLLPIVVYEGRDLFNSECSRVCIYS